MAGTTPHITNNNAVHGTKLHLRNESFHQHYHRHSSSKVHHYHEAATNTHSSSKVHQTSHGLHQQPQIKNVQTIPIRLLINNGSVSRVTSVPLVAKVSVTVSRSNQPSSSKHTPNVKVNAHPPLTRLYTAHPPPRPPAVYKFPDSPRVVHTNKTLPEKPPPYEQIFDVSTDDDDSEPIECPSLLVGSAPRKEKKRSLRSRLLRHITGQKAAAQAARRASMAGSRKARTPDGSPRIRPRAASCTQLIIQPTTSNGIVHIVRNGTSTQLQTQTIPGDSFINTQIQNIQQLSNGVYHNHTPLIATSSNAAANSQVILLHTVPEEDSYESSSSSAKLFSHAVLNISTTSELSSVSSPIHVNIVSPGPSQPPRSPRTSSVFIHPQLSSKEPALQRETNTLASNTNNEEVPIIVPQAQSVDSSLLSSKKSQVTSDKSSNGKVYFSQSQYSSRSEEKQTEPVNATSYDHMQKQHQKKNNVRRKEKTEECVKVEELFQTNRYTINLKPGMYKVNFNFASKRKGTKTQTIDITVPSPVTQTNISQHYLGKPPLSAELLYYDHSSKVSLPQRFVHLLKPSGLGSSRTQKSRNTPKVTIIQESPDKKGSQVITVLTPGEKHQQVDRQQASSSNGHRRGIGGCPTRSHKKERYRWASFPCVHMSSTSGLEETVSEASVCDSWQGYEGVEHLKRQSECQKIVPYASKTEDTMPCDLCCGKQGYCNGELLNYNNYSEKDGSCDGSLDSCVLCSSLGKCKSKKIDLITRLPQSQQTKLNPDTKSAKNLKKNWLEDEEFLRKVVDEYFMDPISSSDDNCDTIIGDNSSNNSEKCSTIDADEESSMVDSQVVTRKSEESQIISIEKCDDTLVPYENSFDDSFYCETDETVSSLFSDDSLGYDADIEDIENRTWFDNLQNSFDEACSKVLRSINLIKQEIDFKSNISSSDSDVTAPAVTMLDGASESVDSLKNVGKASMVGDVGTSNALSLVTATKRGTRRGELARETEIGREGGGQDSRAESVAVATLAIDTASGDVDFPPPGDACASHRCEQQCHFGCRGEGGTSTSQLLVNVTEEVTSNNKLNLAITKVKPLKLQKFADSLYSLKSSVTDSCDSLCSACRKETSYFESGKFIKTFTSENDAKSEYDFNKTEFPNVERVSNEVLKSGLVFERSEDKFTSHKFDLKSALQSIHQLECDEDSFSQSNISDSVFAPNSSFGLSSSLRTGSEEDMANVDIKMNIPQSYYNSNFLYQMKSNGTSSNNTSYANIDIGDSVSVENLAVPASRGKMRRPPRPPKYTSIDDNKYEAYDFGVSSGSRSEVTSPNKYIQKIRTRTPGLVSFSGSSTDEGCGINKMDDVPCIKPGRKRFAKAFQRAVIQVPVSASGDGQSTPPVETVKSELLINPQFSTPSHISLEQTSLGAGTCISEYKIGDSPSLSGKTFQLSDIKSGRCDTYSSDTDSKKAKFRKCRKSKPRKYFSGILDAIGNATPLFRNSLGSSSTNSDDRDVNSDSTSTPPVTPKQSEASYSYLWDPSSQSTTTASIPIQSTDSQRKEIPLGTEVTFSRDISSPLLAAAYENNLEATDARNHWRAAYLGHVGCDSPLLTSACVNDCIYNENSTGNETVESNVYPSSKKNFENKLINGNGDNLSSSDLLYENVVFHKNLKKVPRFNVDINDADEYGDKTDFQNITTTATITLNCKQLNKHNSDIEIGRHLSTDNDNLYDLPNQTVPSFETCTVSASFSMADLNYEDWCSAMGDHDESNRQDSETETSFGKRSNSSESLHSEASSFYYTAGANTIYEAVKSVRKSFADEYDYSENELETNTECDSSDEVTYNTTTQETKYISTDDEFVEEQTIAVSSSTSSNGSNLMEQLNELKEKYFRNPPKTDENVAKSNPNESSDDYAKESKGSKFLNDSHEGIVRAIPCVVLTDSDSPNESISTLSVDSSRNAHWKDRDGVKASRAQSSFWNSKASYENADLKYSKIGKDTVHVELDEGSEISEEIDKRMSGMWTSFTGGDADEESGGDNSESTNSGSKAYEFVYTDNHREPSTSLPENHNSHSFGTVNGYRNSCKFPCEQNCWCSPHNTFHSYHRNYENAPSYTCGESSCKNSCHYNSYSYSHEDILEIPKSKDANYNLSSNQSSQVSFPAQPDEYHLNNTSSYEFSNQNHFTENSRNNCTTDSDQSFSYDSNDNEDVNAWEDKENDKNVENKNNVDFLDVPQNECNGSWSRHYRDPILEDSNNSSLLDDVITCLGGKWNVSSAPGSPGSTAVQTSTATFTNKISSKPVDTPVRTNSYRSSRSGKPPVSPGTRPKDGRSSSSRPQARRRSRSASSGAILKGGNNSSVARPASMVGLPRPSSLADIVPGTAVYSASQESLHSVSFLPSSFDDLAPRPQWLAERKKAEGNEAYRNKEYRDAIQHYTQAIDLCPDCAAYYSNRSACYMMIGKYRDALNDAQKAVNLDTTFVKGWLRVGKCHVALGDGGAAVSVLKQAQELEPNNTALIQEIASAEALQKCVEECNKAVEKKDYRTAVFHLDQALRYALGGLELRISKAEYLSFLGRHSDAEDIVNDILMGDNNHADALYVRGLCRYYQDNQDAAFQHFQKVLRLVPDHNKAKETYKRAKLLILKKEQGNTAFKMGDFARAMEIYSEALEIDERNKSTNSKLYCNRATVASKLGKLHQAIADCSTALLLDDSYIKAYLRRANTYQQTEQYEEAVRDLEKVYRIQRSQEHKRLLHEAKVQLKRSKRKDYYKILGVSKTASEDEIKKAYRKMALLHHPDRHSSASTAEKAEHEKKFKELGEAYAVLTDPKKRAMHDRGQDVNDPECAGFSSQTSFDPNQVFAEFFGPDFFASQSHHYYEQSQGQGQPPPQPQQQFQGQQFQGQHGFQGFPGMSGGFQFGY